jgi:ABC-type branched-subunit amino acid transport system substrate-binding protein
MKSATWLFLVIAALTYTKLSSSQEAPSGELSHWDQALESYKQEDFGAAAIHLQKVIQQDTSTWESAAWLMLARSYLQMGMLPSARQSAEKLIGKYPHGRYASYAHFILAQVDFRQQRFLAASLELLAAAQNTRDDELNLLARSKLDRLFEIYLTQSQKEAVMGLAELPQIQAELAAVKQGQRLPLKVGVILQLSGSRGDDGLKLLAGIELAASEGARRQRLEVEIISRDSRGSVVEAIRAAQALIDEEGVIALIGDVEGSCSAAVAAVARERGVPLIIPSSQEVDLVEVGPDVFQLLPNFRLEGEAAAIYAYKSLGCRKIAILAPASGEGRHRVAGFQDRFTASGGTIATVQWYYEESTNFQRLIASISGDTNEQSPSTPAIDTGTEDTLELPLGTELLSDSAQVDQTINGVDALFIPVQGEEIALLAPQLAAAGFNRPLIGDAACLELIGRESIRRYVTDMAFPANFTEGAGVSLETDFARTFQTRSGAWPDRWNLLGWDAFQFLAQGLKDTGKTSSQKIAGRLRQIRRFTGVRAEMVFPPGQRVNHTLYILNYENGQLRVVKTPLEVAREMQQ